jgi:subtilase family serine protease
VKRTTTRIIVSILGLIFLTASLGEGHYQGPSRNMVRLSGHVLPALAKATALPSKPNSDAQPLTLTVVLRRDDQTGFERYLHELYDPRSKNFHHFLTLRAVADRFGPSRDAYSSLLRYFRQYGFELVHGTNDRLTVIVRGTRADAEHAFDVTFGDYKIGGITFYAVARDPAVPAGLSAHILDIGGLSNLALARPINQALKYPGLPQNPPRPPNRRRRAVRLRHRPQRHPPL